MTPQEKKLRENVIRRLAVSREINTECASLLLEELETGQTNHQTNESRSAFPIQIQQVNEAFPTFQNHTSITSDGEDSEAPTLPVLKPPTSVGVIPEGPAQETAFDREMRLFQQRAEEHQRRMLEISKLDSAYNGVEDFEWTQAMRRVRRM